MLKIYPQAKDADEIVRAINKYCNEFEINTHERMAHFWGQIGAEAGNTLSKLSELETYSPRQIVKIFAKSSNGHLFELAKLDSETYLYSYEPIKYNCANCVGNAIDKGSSTFSMTTNQIRNAYAEKKIDKIVKINNKQEVKKLFPDNDRSDVTKNNIETIVTDKNYNEGRLRVKEEYIRSERLFDVTYACSNGNGSIDSRDGSTYRGVGFIHLTWKCNYEGAVNIWNKMFPNDQLVLDHNLINLAKQDIETAMKLAMAYWKLKNINQYISTSEINENDILNVSILVNGGNLSTQNEPNGYSDRKKYTNNAYTILLQ